MDEEGLFQVPQDMQMVCRIDPSFWFGFTAGELRARGGKIPEEIPDSAVYREPGVFDYVTVTYEWKWTFEDQGK